MQVGTDTRWVVVGAGYWHTAALKTDGTLWAWGWNLYGQLGSGSNPAQNTPQRIP
jgi:alpha-tubulin suppressor-like RCC1 family protein